MLEASMNESSLASFMTALGEVVPQDPRYSMPYLLRRVEPKKNLFPTYASLH